MSVSSDEETPALIVDNGSLSSKSGFAGDDCFRSVVSTVVGRHDYNLWMTGMDGKESYIGQEAQYKRGLLSLNYPISRGIITNWDDMEEIWSNIFYHDLNITTEERPVLLTEPPMNPRKNRERMIETMFETYHVPATYIALQPILSMYASGRGSALIFECGEGVSDVIAIYEGYAIRTATRRIPFAGCDITDNLAKRLNERGNSFVTLADKEIVRDIKEKHCYVSLDYDKECQSFGSFDRMEKKYELPDGRMISVGPECFQCTEGLFRPDILGISSDGVHNQIFESVMQCDIDTRRDLLVSVIISGGTTLAPGFVQRLQNELNTLVPCTTRVRTVAAPERKHLVWIGGSIIASLSTFQNTWITKSEYDENGSNIVHVKCLHM